MTEKRYSFNWERGHPNFWDNYCDLADCYLTCEDVVKRLNELNDENEQLNENNLHLHHELRLKNDKVLELEKENKELKQQLESEHTMLDNAILLERTRMGKNSLIQYREAIQ